MPDLFANVFALTVAGTYAPSDVILRLLWKRLSSVRPQLSDTNTRCEEHPNVSSMR
jgi:hypothetical protein